MIEKVDKDTEKMEQNKKEVIINANIKDVFNKIKKVGLSLFEEEITQDNMYYGKVAPLFTEELEEEIPYEKISYTAKLAPYPNFPKVTITWNLKKIDERRTQVSVTIVNLQYNKKAKPSNKRRGTLYVSCSTPICKYVIKEAKKLPSYVDAYRVTSIDNEAETDVIIELKVQSEQELLKVKKTFMNIEKVKEVIPEISVSK